MAAESALDDTIMIYAKDIVLESMFFFKYTKEMKHSDRRCKENREIKSARGRG